MIMGISAANWSNTTREKYERLNVLHEDMADEMNSDVERLYRARDTQA
jgi:hypothetical protein